MDVRLMAKELPQEPSRALMQWAESALAEELGGHLLLFHRESWIPGMDQEIGWPLAESEERHRWAAHCRCSACGAEWWSGWRGIGSVLFAASDDGSIYPGVPDFEMDYAVNEIPAGFEVYCPYCESIVCLTHRSKLRRGRTCQVMVAEVANVGTYTALIYWMLRRRFYQDEHDETDAYPALAMVMDEAGNLVGFTSCSWTGRGHICEDESAQGWRPLRALHDPSQGRYYSQEAFCHTKMGACVYHEVPDQLGQTGEKTGLVDYIRQGGEWPFLYWRFWGVHRTVENLIKAGWVHTIDCCIQASIDSTLFGRTDWPDHLECAADWSRAKPSEMLYMTRQEIRDGRSWEWDANVLELWWTLVAQLDAGPGDAAVMQRMLSRYGIANLQRWEENFEDGLELTLTDCDAYLSRQHARYGLELKAGFEMLIDYRRMLARITDAPQQIELWPPDLRAAHDRIAAAQKLEESQAESAQFMAVREKWLDLEWSDGDICAVLPRSNQALIAEGRTLHHCVGGYGNTHLSGQLIIFIRHARRPERSWYTLNIDTTKETWREIQLHGYGNERGAHGARLTIPRAVRAFVDRWENEVLTPVFYRVTAQSRPKKKRRRKDAA